MRRYIYSPTGEVRSFDGNWGRMAPDTTTAGFETNADCVDMLYHGRISLREEKGDRLLFQ